MIELGPILTIAAAVAVVAASPGPANLAVATTAMARGRRPSMALAAGLSMGLSAWGLAAALGLGAVLAASTAALTILELAGAVYLAWLAISSARAAVALDPPGSRCDQGAEGRWLLRGVLLNLSNPKAVFAWLAALSMGLSPDAGIGALTLATTLCMAIGLVNYVAWATVFSLGGAMRACRRARRWIEGVTAALFATASVRLLRSAHAR